MIMTKATHTLIISKEYFPSLCAFLRIPTKRREKHQILFLKVETELNMYFENPKDRLTQLNAFVQILDSKVVSQTKKTAAYTFK